MIGLVTIVERQEAIHWEAVLITAVPAFFAMVAAIGTAWIGRKNKQHLEAIDKSVNGIEPGNPTLRESVEKIAENTETDVSK